MNSDDDDFAPKTVFALAQEIVERLSVDSEADNEPLYNEVADVANVKETEQDIQRWIDACRLDVAVKIYQIINRKYSADIEKSDEIFTVTDEYNPDLRSDRELERDDEIEYKKNCIRLIEEFRRLCCDGWKQQHGMRSIGIEDCLIKRFRHESTRDKVFSIVKKSGIIDGLRQQKTVSPDKVIASGCSAEKFEDGDYYCIAISNLPSELVRCQRSQGRDR